MSENILTPASEPSGGDWYDLIAQWRDLLEGIPFEDWRKWSGQDIIEFFFGIRYPRKTGRLIDKLWSGEVRDAIVAGPRGGGKSMLDAMVEFLMWMFGDFDVVNIGGSEAQAQNVYAYLQGFMAQYRQQLADLTDLGGRAPISPLLKETMSRTVGKTDPAKLHRPILRDQDGNVLDDEDFAGPPLAKDSSKFIAVLAASQKQVRGPHAGSERRGGLLVIDEEAEVAGDIVNAAMYTVNTAKPRLVLRTSTYHSAVGTFADDFEDAAAKGIYRVRFSIFDVCKTCPYAITTPEQWEAIENETGRAPGDDDDPFIKTLPMMQPDCSNCPRPAHFRDPITGSDPLTGEPKIVRHPYCGGRAAFAINGWMGWTDDAGVLKQFDQRPSDQDFEVELCGLRPSTKGLVITDREALDNAAVDDELCEYIPNSGETIGMIDWGLLGMCAAICIQNRPIENPPFGRRVIIDCQDLARQGISAVVDAMKVWRDIYGMTEIWADSSHPYENLELTNAGFYVRPVKFQTEKELGAGSINYHLEKGALWIPRDQGRIITKQLKGWRRNDSGQIVKGDDHFCDSLLCGLLRYLQMVAFIASPKSQGEARRSGEVNTQAGAHTRHSAPQKAAGGALVTTARADDLRMVSPIGGGQQAAASAMLRMQERLTGGGGRRMQISVPPQETPQEPPQWQENQPAKGSAMDKLFAEAREKAERLRNGR